jgi:Secretion system C-terminal sorting domain
VSYTMTTASNGWMSEQRTLLVCTTNSTTEAAIASGVGGATGTYSYNRTGLNIANGLTGSVTYNLRAWRTYGGSGCSAEFNKVDNNSLRITVTLNQLLSSPEAAAQRVKVYPAPFTDLLHLDHADEVKTISFTDLTGKVVRTVEHPSPTIQLEDLASGLYLLRMTMQDGTIQHTKAIKQ